MIAPMPNLPLLLAHASSGARRPDTKASGTPFEDVLAAMKSTAVQEQTAIAFDVCSMFGAAPPTSTANLAVKAPRIESPQAASPISHPSAVTQQNATANQAPGGAQRASPGPHHDQSAAPIAPIRRNLPARTLTASLAAVHPLPASASRASATISQPSSAAKARAQPTKAQSLQPIAIAVHETELGLRVVARAPALSSNDLTELRSEAEALLARHGYRIAGLDIATAKKE